MSHHAVTPAETPLARLIRQRRTINDFLPQIPEREIVLQAVELARWAPNHKLTEPWRFHLLGPETIAQIIELNAQLTAADKGEAAAAQKRAKWSTIPGWLVVTSQCAANPMRHQENYAAVCCAIQNLMLFLEEQGLGTKWVTGPVTQHQEFNRLLNLNPEVEMMVGMIWYGYPASRSMTQRQPVSDIVIEHP